LFLAWLKKEMGSYGVYAGFANIDFRFFGQNTLISGLFVVLMR